MSKPVRFDWDAIWAAGEAETARIERKAKRPPLPEGVTKKECRQAVRGHVAELATRAGDASAGKEFRLLHRRCDLCRRCAVPPA